jgi:hypothetical protein
MTALIIIALILLLSPRCLVRIILVAGTIAIVAARTGADAHARAQALIWTPPVLMRQAVSDTSDSWDAVVVSYVEELPETALAAPRPESRQARLAGDDH